MIERETDIETMRQSRPPKGRFAPFGKGVSQKRFGSVGRGVNVRTGQGANLEPRRKLATERWIGTF